MWCPKCKNEYIAGITRCPDCDTALVESLPPKKNDTAENDSIEYNSMEYNSMENNSMENNSIKNDSMKTEKTSFHTYVSNRSRKEDISSTAYTFTVAGAIGLIVLLLILFEIIPVNISDYMKIMSGIVLGGLFLIFLAIGLHSFRQLKGMDEIIASEEKAFWEITGWFRASYSKEDLTAQYTEMDQPEEQLYFIRYEWMSRLLKEKYPDPEDSFLDYIIETLYPEYFS